MLNAIVEAASKGVQLLVFPETFVPWHPYFSFVLPPVLSGKEHLRLYEEAVIVPSEVTDALAAAARRHGMVIVLGVNERDHGSLYNTQRGQFHAETHRGTINRHAVLPDNLFKITVADAVAPISSAHRKTSP